MNTTQMDEQPQDREVWEHYDSDCVRCIGGNRPEFDDDLGYWWHALDDQTVRCGARWRLYD